MNKLYPGFELKSELWTIKMDVAKRVMNNHVIPFLSLPKNAVCLDWGEENPRMRYMAKEMGIKVDWFAPPDLNFASYKGKKYDAVFAFEILEHIANALWSVKQMKNAIKDDGVIYVYIPENPRFLWDSHHYFELDRKHLDKWILKPLGLKIVRHKKIIFVHDWRAYFIGIRPLIRVIRGETSIRDFFRTLFYIQFHIYDIRKG